MDVEGAKDRDGALGTSKLHGNARGAPSKNWSWGKGTFGKEFQCLNFQVRCTHFEGQMTESGIALCSNIKNSNWKNGFSWPVAVSACVARGRQPGCVPGGSKKVAFVTFVNLVWPIGSAW